MRGGTRAVDGMAGGEEMWRGTGGARGSDVAVEGIVVRILKHFCASPPLFQMVLFEWIRFLRSFLRF